MLPCCLTSRQHAQGYELDTSPGGNLVDSFSAIKQITQIHREFLDHSTPKNKMKKKDLMFESFPCDDSYSKVVFGLGKQDSQICRRFFLPSTACL